MWRCGPQPTHYGDEELVIRLQSLTTTQAVLYADESRCLDGTTATETVDYLVLEATSADLTTGLQVGLVQSPSNHDDGFVSVFHRQSAVAFCRCPFSTLA